MLWLIFVTSLVFIGLVLYTRDNIYAALLLTGLGVVVALGTAAYLGALAFILVALVYIAASLTLVIIAAGTLGDVKKTIEPRLTAAAGLAVVFMPILIRTNDVSMPAADLDVYILVILTAFVLYALKIAVEMSI